MYDTGMPGYSLNGDTSFFYFFFIFFKKIIHINYVRTSRGTQYMTYFCKNLFFFIFPPESILVNLVRYRYRYKLFLNPSRKRSIILRSSSTFLLSSHLQQIIHTKYTYVHNELFHIMKNTALTSKHIDKLFRLSS